MHKLEQDIRQKDHFDTFFRENYPALLNYAYRFLNDRSTAEDVLQECFINLWNIRNEIDRNGSLKAYTYKMVRNRALNYIRDNQKETPTESFSDDKVDSLNQENENETGTLKKMHLLKNWIKTLPVRQREAFELSRFEGLDHDEISEVMKISPRTVNNHIVEALNTLRLKFTDYQTNN